MKKVLLLTALLTLLLAAVCVCRAATVLKCTHCNEWIEPKWKVEGDSHSRYCPRCGHISTVHSGYGATGTYKSNTAQHWNPCTGWSLCTVRFNSADHTFVWIYSDGNHICKCSVCGYIDTSKSHTHRYGAWYADGGNHVNACGYSGCDLKEQHASQVDTRYLAYNAESYYNYCEYANCDITVNPTAHKMIWAQDDSGHSYFCETCGYEDSAKTHPRQWGAWYARSEFTHETLCQYSGCTVSTEHFAEFDQFEYGCDADTHYNICTHSGCGLKVAQRPHSFEWTQSGSLHSYVCGTCGYEDTNKTHEHSAGAWYLTAGEALCVNDCTYTGCVLGVSHTPAPKAEFSMDAVSHWHDCTAQGCTNRLEVTPHTMIWYPTKEGYSYRCEVCSYRAKDVNGNSTEIKAGRRAVMWKSEWVIAKVEDGMVTMVSAQVYDNARYESIEAQLKDGLLLPYQLEFLAEPAREADAEYAGEYFGGEACHIQIILPMGRMESQMIYGGKTPE